MNRASRPLITIVYAHEPEVKALKHILKESGLDAHVTWRRWRNTSDTLFINGAPDPDLILNIGFAGRLSPDLIIGEVAAALPSGGAVRSVVDRLRQVSLMTVAKPVVDELEREALYKETGADIVDMEAGFLSDLAATAGIPFAAIKLISDNADGDARAAIDRRIDEWSERLAVQVNRCLGDLLAI